MVFRFLTFELIPAVATAQPGALVTVPITVLLYDGPLLCDFNVAIKGLNVCSHPFSKRIGT